MRLWETLDGRRLDAKWFGYARANHNHQWQWALVSTCAGCRALLLKEVWPCR